MAMGRRRTKNLKLPPRMQKKGNVFYYTPYVLGKLKWIRLADNYPEAISAWAKHEGTATTGTTVGHALDRVLIEVIPTKAPATQREYVRYAAALRPIFADTALCDVRPTHIAQYLDMSSAKIQANREMALLSTVFRFAMRWGWCDSNPCIGVRRNKEVPRDRYIEDYELAVLRGLASDSMRAMIDLVYLTGMRKSDMLKLRLSDLREDGIHVEQGKTGKRQIFEWTDALREIVDRARGLRRRVGSLYLFAGRNGQPYTTSGFDSIWQRIRNKSGLENLTFHDVRGKTGSDSDSDAAAAKLLGHADPRTTRKTYRRRGEKVRPLR